MLHTKRLLRELQLRAEGDRALHPRRQLRWIQTQGRFKLIEMLAGLCSTGPVDTLLAMVALLLGLYVCCVFILGDVHGIAYAARPLPRGLVPLAV